MTEEKNQTELEKLENGNGEVFQIIGSNCKTLHLKGEESGQDIKIKVTDIFKGIENKTIKMKPKPIPIVKIDGRKRKVN